jgi:ABC-2 type transport system permease protein
MRLLLALVRKDLQIFMSDRRAVIVSFVVPIAIASFFGSLFQEPAPNAAPPRLEISIVDRDRSAISKAIVASAAADSSLRVSTPSLAETEAAVRSGKTSVAVVIPPGFGPAAGTAFFSVGPKPPLQFLYDPSRSMELAMVRGLMTQHIMQAVSREMFAGAQGRVVVEQALPLMATSSMPADQKEALVRLLRSAQDYYGQQRSWPSGATAPGLSLPYEVQQRALTATPAVRYNGYAHSFAGMGIQFLLFAMANMGVEILLERQRGLWKRLRAAPVSRLTLLAGKAASGTVISLMILLASFGFAMLVFGVRIEGSVPGFFVVSLACSIMAATFGLLIAALGRSPAAARGITTLVVLMMVMLGGAWVPTFVFPPWLQKATQVVPVRWAVDGLDAMSWRGIGFEGALLPSLVLLGFAALFALVAALRFVWEES